MPRRRPANVRAGSRRRQFLNERLAVPECDWLAVRVISSHPTLLHGVHVMIEIDGVALLNTFHDGFSHVVGTHPDSFFAPASAVWAHDAHRAYLPVGDPVDCQPECCGVGARVRAQGELVHWQLIGDRWNRDLLSAHLQFDREEYLFTLQSAHDRWSARSLEQGEPSSPHQLGTGQLRGRINQDTATSRRN